MNVNYDYYKVFYYVAKYKSFSRAAQALMSNQPNVTKLINKLEQQLNCTLFIRTNRGITLTQEGEMLMTHVSVAYDQIHEAELELENSNNLKSGTVTVGVSETALHGILLPVLSDFRNFYPDIHIRILNYSTPQALTALKNGAIDFAIVTTPLDANKGFVKTDLKKYSERLVCGRRYKELSSKKIRLKDTVKYPLIMLSRDSGSYQFYTQLYLQHGLILKSDTEVATSGQLLLLIQNDLGIGFVPEFLAEPAINGGEVFEVTLHEKIPSRAVCMVEDSSKHLSIASKALKQSLLDTLQTDK